MKIVHWTEKIEGPSSDKIFLCVDRNMAERCRPSLTRFPAANRKGSFHTALEITKPEGVTEIYTPPCLRAISFAKITLGAPFLAPKLPKRHSSNMKRQNIFEHAIQSLPSLLQIANGKEPLFRVDNSSHKQTTS